MVAAATLMGLSSCNKDAEGGVVGGDPMGSGSMKITLGFDSAESATYATASTAKPSTSWKNNIQSLGVFFVEKSSGEIKNAQSVPFDNTKVDLAEQTKTIKGIPAGTYDVYVFANWDQGGHTDVNKADWSIATAKGRKIQDLYVDALASTTYDAYKHTNAEADSKGYDEAPEVFVAMHTGITITADETFQDETAYALTRIVSLVRVRIDQSVNNDENKNNLITFQDANASLRIRRIHTGATLQYSEANMTTTTRRFESDASNSVFFAQGAYKHEDPSTGYSSGKILTDNFTSWKDVKLIPAGSTTAAAEKLDVVITGITTNGEYVPAGFPKKIDMDGAGPGEAALVEKAPQGAQIAWAGAVDYVLKGNGIMELNLTLLSAGQWVNPEVPDLPLPEPQEYGNLEIKVGLADWGAIESVDMNM